jgi:hypothetical protein
MKRDQISLKALNTVTLAMKSMDSDYSAENVSKTMKGKQLAEDSSLDFSKNSDKLGLSLEAYDDGVSDMCNGMKMALFRFEMPFLLEFTAFGLKNF